MWAQLEPWLKEQGRRLLRWLGAALVLAARACAPGWALIRPSVIFALNVLVALLLLFEEWGWRPLSNLLAQLARFRIWALAELWIAGLPPYGALVALGVPSTILIPAKLFGVYLLATGHIVTAAVMHCLRPSSPARRLIARIFLLTKPALMQISWFRRAYDCFVPWQEALFAWIRGSCGVALWARGEMARWRLPCGARGSGCARSSWRHGTRFKPRAIALMGRLRLRGREAWTRASLAGERLLRRLQGPQG